MYLKYIYFMQSNYIYIFMFLIKNILQLYLSIPNKYT